MIINSDTIQKIKMKFWFLLNKSRFKSIGKNSFIDSSIKITPSCISFGESVRVFKNSRIEGVFLYNNIFFSPNIKFNKNVSVQQNLHLTCAKSITIGENTALGPNVTITDIHHNYSNIKIPIEEQDISVNEVKIGKNCKIYSNVVVLPGCSIGNHVTIGANSVVAIEVPDYCVVVGAPAKIVKRYNLKSKSWHKTNPDGTFLKLSK